MEAAEVYLPSSPWKITDGKVNKLDQAQKKMSEVIQTLQRKELRNPPEKYPEVEEESSE